MVYMAKTQMCMKGICGTIIKNELMKGKALRKHSLHEKTAASVLLKLFISEVNKICNILTLVKY